MLKTVHKPDAWVNVIPAYGSKLDRRQQRAVCMKAIGQLDRLKWVESTHSRNQLADVSQRCFGN